ncbi:D-alanyl-D-alanine carboxypeptidase family protein [Xanthobacter oligotrophicus]|uniref:D-alanyl-D-alanine carboxypeptidase family protein n=1 Tax=Xanthobacter oligotrophicus TaxID=2607286 RepID=UPI001E626B94|nr:D-alanyl-D-alanine carboxypeptidase family protein [Xanthobacter oligotrophicus]MCG5235056.1 serine hydrolase [Xanthobacter oligotrophicus]
MGDAGRGLCLGLGRGLAAAVLGLALAGSLLVHPAQANPVLLVEADTGRVIEQKEAGRPWHPASVTKLMTIYVALNAVKNGRLTLDTPLTVSAAAASQQPSKMGFKPGTVVTLDNAMKMVLVKSANDMAWVVGEGVAGSMPAFVSEMNTTAAHLGMSGTHFENPNGLPDPDQITTARDLAILARAIIYHFPEHEALFRIPAIKIGKAVLRNYNRLIDRYPGADGMKTGFVCGSGYNLVATATRGNKRLIAVILGARSGTARTEQAALMFEKGFQSSWGVFGAAQPLLSNISNTGGPAYDMKPEVCGGKRAVTASEADDESEGGSGGFAFAAPVLPKSGAELLQTLPPSMPPVVVYVGTRGAPQDLATAYPEEEKPKKKPGAKDTKQAKASAGSESASAESGDGTKPAAKDASKPKPKTAGSKPTTATASAGDEPKAAAKPKSATASTSGDKPASGTAQKKQVQPQAPVTAGSVPAPKPKPKPKPADTPAETAAPAPKPAT